MAGRFGQEISAGANRGGAAEAALAGALAQFVRLLARQAARETLDTEDLSRPVQEDSDA
jgi:hypothetical protein